ncbi:hypothetical protein, partial [Vibrio fluvialis]|uniref:hypothetical protein n=1 Tax=Vibrio fluvialis TaxID=676 RepID=UPI001F2EFA78
VQTLNDPNASLEQKQQAQQVLVNNIAAQMKVDPAVVLQAMITDEKNEATKGGYINGGNTLYVNGDMHDTLQDEANTVGHEMQHYLDDKAGTTAGNATEDFLGFNYGNLTDTTFGGDINHTASTNAPGSGVLLDTNTSQFNQAKEQGELENRFLTPADISKAQELAKNSNGKFSIEEIKDALRHTIADDGEEYPDGMSANLIDVNQLDPDLASQIDGSNGHLIVAQGEDGQGRYIVQDMSQIPLDGDVKQYIENSGSGYEFYELQPQQNAMGEYDWLTGKPLDTNGQYVISHAVEGKQYNVSYMPCATADCIASNANMKYSADYEKATGAKALSDVSTMASGVILLTPAGPVVNGALNGGKIAVGVAGYIGLTSDIGTAVLKDEIVKSSVKEGGSRLSQVALKELAGELATGKLDALIGLSGFYDKSVEQIPNDNILKKDIFGDESK